MQQPCVVMLPEGGVVSRRAASERPQATRFAGAFSMASENGVFRSAWAAPWSVLLRPGMFVNFAPPPWGPFHRRSPYLGPSNWTVGGGGRAAQRASQGGSRVSIAGVLAGPFPELVASTYGLFLRERGVLSTGPRSALPPSPIHVERPAGTTSREEALSRPFNVQRVVSSGEPRTSPQRRGEAGRGGLTTNVVYPELFNTFRRLGAPPNTALLLTACLRRGRRCRPLAARTAAAECHVGLVERA